MDDARLSMRGGLQKDSVRDRTLHDAYFEVWRAMAGIQNPPPYRRR